MLAKVSFGPQTLVGVIVNVTQHSQVPKKKQKPILTLLDSQPVIPPIMLELAQWIANYYHYPLGLTLAHMMPKALQQTKTKLNLWQTVYRRCDHTPPNLSKIQKNLLQWIENSAYAADESSLLGAGFQTRTIGSLVKKQALKASEPPIFTSGSLKPADFDLNTMQKQAVDTINAAIFLYPEDPEWYSLLGDFQERNGDIEAAWP